jgi:hypothetical protein
VLMGHALVAATILNVNRPKKTSPVVQPEDLIRTHRVEEDYLSVEESIQTLDRWAAGVNAEVKAFAERKKGASA